MNSRMPSLRRPGQTTQPTEDGKSLLPRQARNAPASGLPTPSPTRPTLKTKDDRAAMPPPPAPSATASTPLARAQSTRTTRNLPPPARSGIAALPASGISRSMSTKAPVPLRTAAPRIIPHSRTNSVDTADTALKRSSTIAAHRLRSQSSATDSGNKAPLSPTTPTDSAKPPLRRLTRPTATSTAAPNLEQRRPAFNTLRQHYSPAKSTLPKPPVPSARVGPSAQEKAVVSGAAFETTKLQSELLYLSILHESAESTRLKYQRSAQKALKKEFISVQQEIQETRDQERLVQEQLNLSALAEWLGLSKQKAAHLSQESAEAIQCLSACLSELITLSAPESKYSDIVRTFTSWIAQVSGESSTAQLMVGPLPHDWHQTHASVSQRLRLLERDVEMLPSSPKTTREDTAESSLAIVLRCLQALVTGMKQELDEMAKLERQIVSTEKQRVGSAVAGLFLDTLLQASDDWSPAW